MSRSTIEKLMRADWQLPSPFTVELADGSSLAFCRVLRWLPCRRVSGEALWNGRPVFAKLFLGEAAQRHAEREQAGIEALQAGGLPTPRLLATFVCPGDARLVLSEFVPAACSLEGASGDLSQLLPAFALLGRLHAAGLVHDDLHLGNFLFSDGQVQLIDGDGIHPANASQQLDNLALLLSQLPVILDDVRQSLLSAYGREVDVNKLDALVDGWRQRRRDRFLAKVFRNCTQFAVVQGKGRFLSVLRTLQGRLTDLLAQPDAAIESGLRLKSGGTCTVAVTQVGDQSVVVKRYNLKNWRHALSRLWRPSRAWHSWREAHRLAFYGIATPSPLAMLEERWGPLRGRAFLITEFCPGVSLAEALSADVLPEPDLAQAIERFFTLLWRLQISHGDLKASNLLWHEGGLYAIDLDAMVQHRSQASFRQAWRRDRARLLRNWPSSSPLSRWLDRILPAA